MTIEIRNPRVAVVFFSFLLDESLAEERKHYSLSKLESTGLDIACGVSVRSTEQVEKAIAEVNVADADLAVLVFRDWVREDLPIAVARDLHAPLLLWGIVGESEYLPLAGVTCTASNLMRIGVSFRYVVGSIENTDTLDQLREWARVTTVIRMLKSFRVGVVGLGCPGLISTGASEISVRRLGPDMVVLDSLRLIAEYEKVQEASIVESANSFRDPVFHLDGVVEDDLRNAVRLYSAIKEIVSQEDLDIIGIRCWPDLRQYYGLSPCVAFSRLMDEGVMGSCENDPLAGISMALGYWLTQSPVFGADINTVLEKEQLLKLWHCGAAPLALKGSEKVEVRKTFYDNSGCTLEFPLKPGAVTLFEISRPHEGKFRMFVASGEIIKHKGPVRGNVADVHLSVPAAQFVDALVGGGFEHHIVVAYGEIASELEKLCELLDLTLVRA